MKTEELLARSQASTPAQPAMLAELAEEYVILSEVMNGYVHERELTPDDISTADTIQKRITKVKTQIIDIVYVPGSEETYTVIGTYVITVGPTHTGDVGVSIYKNYIDKAPLAE